MSATDAPEELVAANPRRVLDELDDLTGRARTVRRKIRDLAKPKEDPARVRVVRLSPGRLTGWGVKCSEHGTLGPAKDQPLVIPRRSGARAAAVDHVNAEHPEGARLVVERG